MRGKRDDDICIDVFSPEKPLLTGNFLCRRMISPYGPYWHIVCRKDDFPGLRRELRRFRIRTYERRWDRSDDFRKRFMESSKGVLYCRYCGRRLSRKYLQVDHVVPVSRTKKGGISRFLLEIRGIRNVNDIRNLAPSCGRCNRRKADHLGIWYIRGTLGKYRWYRPAEKIAAAASAAAVIYIAVRLALDWQGAYRLSKIIRKGADWLRF